MNSAVLQRDPLMPRPPGGMGPGLVLALSIHGLLVLALAFSVRWRASEPEGVEAELWAAVPQIAAPPAPAPEPQPVIKPAPPPPPPQPVQRSEPEPDAQIAIEKAKREERERLKKEEEEEKERLAEKRKQEEAQKLAEQRKREQEEKRRRELEDQRIAALREENLKRMLGQAGATGTPSSTGTAARTAGPSSGYAGRIKARIKPNIVFGDSVSGNPLATVEVKLAPDGTIVGRRLVKSSGVQSWDDAVLRAIDKTEVLPRDVDGRVPPSFEIDFRPRD
ncbi:MAG TPA: cell envelope integrity protein TolA [Albitalea sp.]